MASTAMRVISPSRKTGVIIYYNHVMTRRELLAAGAACASTLWARNRIDKSRISAITDEIGLTTDDSIAFAHKYGLQNVEIRNPPKNEPNGKKEYFALTEPEIKADAMRFAREGLKVSFVNTSLLKFAWPGSEPARKRVETPEARERRLAGESALGATRGRSAEGHPLHADHGRRQAAGVCGRARGRSQDHVPADSRYAGRNVEGG